MNGEPLVPTTLLSWSLACVPSIECHDWVLNVAGVLYGNKRVVLEPKLIASARFKLHEGIVDVWTVDEGEGFGDVEVVALKFPHELAWFSAGDLGVGRGRACREVEVEDGRRGIDESLLLDQDGELFDSSTRMNCSKQRAVDSLVVASHIETEWSGLWS